MSPEVELDGASVAYELAGAGSGPVVVLVHSLGTSKRLWDDLVPALAGKFRVLRYDLPGHGASSVACGPYSIGSLANRLSALLDRLGIESASFVGLSIGGMIATQLCIDQPLRVERCVVACSAPVLGTPENWQERAARVRAEGLGFLLEPSIGRWFTSEFRRTRPEVVAATAALLQGCDPEGYASCCEALAGTDLWADLARIRAPTLVVAGTADSVATPEIALRHAAAIPGAELSVLAGASHLANLAAPDRFAQLVVAHLTEGARTSGMAVRRAVLGDAQVERASALPPGGFGAAFQELITAYAWGEVWARPGLDRRTRSAVTLALLVGLGRYEELSFHLPAARRNGLSLAEIEEVLLQCAIYAGVPAANSAFAVARRALAEELDG